LTSPPTVTPHDDFEHHVSSDVALARVLGVVRTNLAEQTWRDIPLPGRYGPPPVPRPILARRRAIAFTNAVPVPVPAPPPLRAVALVLRRRLFEDANAIARIRWRRHDRRDHTGNCSAFSGGARLRFRRRGFGSIVWARAAPAADC
jgi:hypothetical protein